MHTAYLKYRSVKSLAAKMLTNNIVSNGVHPSIIVWSIQNELSSRVGPSQSALIRQQAAIAHRMDPSRPVGLAVAAYPSAPCQAGYRPMDVLGFNDYFGWYPGPGGTLADQDGLSPYLDAVRTCYPNKAIVINATLPPKRGRITMYASAIATTDRTATDAVAKSAPSWIRTTTATM